MTRAPELALLLAFPGWSPYEFTVSQGKLVHVESGERLELAESARPVGVVVDKRGILALLVEHSEARSMPLVAK